MVCNGIYRTDSDAASAAGAFIRCDGGLFLCDGNCVVCTVALAGSAADAFIGKNKGAGGVVHLQFSGAGTAAHTDIFERTSETGGLVTFKMA